MGVVTTSSLSVAALATAAPNLTDSVPVTETTVTAAGIICVVLLLVLSGFFSSSEIAMFSLPLHRLDVLADEGRRGAAVAADLLANPHRLLVTILVGNNLVNVAMSSVATALIGIYTNDPGTAVLLSTLGITSLVLIFGESGPKSYAIENTESWALRVSRPLRLSEYALYPLVVLFDYLSRGINNLFGSQAEIGSQYVTRDEIQEMIEVGEREGALREGEHRLLQRVFQLDQTQAEAVMTPRDEIRAVESTATIADAIQTCVHTGFERLPVYDTSLDRIRGVVNLHDLARTRYGALQKRDIALRTLQQPTFHVSEAATMADVLPRMQDSRVRMVIVTDDDGTTVGLLTMDDIIDALGAGVLFEEASAEGYRAES